MFVAGSMGKAAVDLAVVVEVFANAVWVGISQLLLKVIDSAPSTPHVKIFCTRMNLYQKNWVISIEPNEFRSQKLDRNQIDLVAIAHKNERKRVASKSRVK